MLAALLRLPVLTHALLAALYTAVLIGLALLLAPILALAGLVPSPLVAAAIVSTFFYGREGGQREHDLKNAGVSPLVAWLGAEFMFRWSGDNLVQWFAPAASSLAVAVAFALLA